jgi:phage shock protein C
MVTRRLTRLPGVGKVAGVCAGIAEYFDVDVVLVRAAWVTFSIVPGAIIGGVIAYVAAWLIVPAAPAPDAAAGRHRLVRSSSDQKIAGVCGGLAEYFDVDPTPIRLLWVILSILCGAVVGGVVAYLVAWIVIPRSPAMVHPAATSA